MNIDYLVCKLHKNIQGMAGIGFCHICNKKALSANGKSIPMRGTPIFKRCYAQYAYFEKTIKQEFTPPVQTFMP